MKIGSLVECIRDDWSNNETPINSPKKGDLDIVADIDDCPCGCGVTMLELEGRDKDWLWEASFFREVQPPMTVNIQEIIEEPEIA